MLAVIAAALALAPRLSSPLRQLLQNEGFSGIDATEAVALSAVARGTVRLEELSRRGLYAGSNPSVFHREMRHAGYLVATQNEQDRRSISLQLTPAGLAFSNAFTRTLADAGAEMLRLGVTEDDLLAFSQLCGKLTASLCVLHHQREAGVQPPCP